MTLDDKHKNGEINTIEKISLWVNQCHGENKKRIKKTKKTNEVWKSEFKKHV